MTETTAEGYEPFVARRAQAVTDLRGTEQEYAYARRCPNIAEVNYDNARLTRLGRFRRTPQADSFLTTSTLGLVACIATLALQVHGCSKTHDVVASTQMCSVQQDGHAVCYYDQVITLTVGDTDRHICVTLRDPQARPLGNAIVDVSGVELVCTRLPVYHTRQFVINVASSKRCYRAGSCYNNMCELTTSSTMVPELATANQKPGITYCRNAAGCWANGCWYCVDACLYFRAYAAPTNSRVGEVFECKWRPRMRISVTLQQLGQELRQGAFEIVEAQTVTQGDVSLTVTSISLPPMPSADQRYVHDGKRTAVVDRDHRRILECDTEADAKNLTANCRLLFNPCSCGPTGNVAACDCPRHASVMDALDEEDSVLPRHIGGIWLTNNRSTLLAEADYTGAQIDMSLHNLRMEVRVENNSCEVTPLRTTGCRQCNKGATLEYVCKTNFGSALAEVRCETTEFHAHCNRFGQANRHHFRTDKRKLHEQCIVACPQGESTFTLEASLATLAPEVSTLRHTVGLENLSSGLQWSDVTGFLGDAALFVWHSILQFDLKIWLVTAVVVILASIAMLGGFRYLERNHPDFLRLLLLAVVLPSMGASPRHPFMSHQALHYDDLDLVDAVEHRHEDSELDEGPDEDVFDYDEGNVVTVTDEVEQLSLQPQPDGETIQRKRRQELSAEAELQPFPQYVASIAYLPPASRPAPPPTVPSMVINPDLKQITDHTKVSFELNSECHRDVPGHENCKHLQVRDVDSHASSDLRYQYIRTPLQYALILMAHRDAYGTRRNAFVRQILSCAPSEAIHIYARFRPDRVDAKDSLGRNELLGAMQTRYKCCFPAKDFLRSETHKAIWYRTDVSELVGDKDDQHRLKSLFATLDDILESVRVRELFPGKTRVKSHTVIIGDELSKEFHRSLRNGSYAITAPRAAMITESLRNFVIGNSCKSAIMIVGHEDLREGRKPAEIIEACQSIVAYLRRYPHLQVKWIPIPFLFDQCDEWVRLQEKMATMCVNYTNHTFLRNYEGRDITEIFREGHGHCPERISSIGEPTEYGWRVLARFLKEVVQLRIPWPKAPSRVCGQKGAGPGMPHRSEVSGPPSTKRQLSGPKMPSLVCGQNGIGSGATPRSEVSGPSTSQSRTKTIAELLEDADQALRAVQEARKASERAFHRPAAKRPRAQSPDDDVIFVGTSEHHRVINP